MYVSGCSGGRLPSSRWAARAAVLRDLTPAGAARVSPDPSPLPSPYPPAQAAFEDANDDILAEVAQWQLFGILAVGLVVRTNDLIRETAGDDAVPDSWGLGSLASIILMVGLVVAFGMALQANYRETQASRGRGGDEKELARTSSQTTC